MLGDYYCSECKIAIASQHAKASTLPEARAAAVLGFAGLFLGGFLLGPYTLKRAGEAQAFARRAPWLRSRWQLRAALILGAFATFLGLITLWGVLR